MDWQLLIVGGCVLWAATHLANRIWSLWFDRAGGGCGGSGCGSCGTAKSQPPLVTLEVSAPTNQDEAMRDSDSPAAR